MTLDVRGLTESVYKEVVELRREFHCYPELGFQEFRTSRVIQERLKALDIPYKVVAGTGVVAQLKGKDISSKNEVSLGLRADMDALPLEEQNDLPYRSLNPGIMHACGHDGHIAILLGVAKILKKIEETFYGNVFFIFQPAEEVYGGADPMIKEYGFKDVTRFFGLHLDNMHPAGTIALKSGYMSAFTDEVEIDITGRGGHAAYPQFSVDPIVVSAELIMSLQTVVSRSINPFEPVALTIGRLESGTKHNIIPQTAKLYGTFRTMDEEVRKKVMERIEEVVKGITSAHLATHQISFIPGYPAIYNNPELTTEVERVMVELLGSDKVVEAHLGLGGEDFAYFTQLNPSVFYMVGSAFEDISKVFPHHHPRFDFDEQALFTGVLSLTTLALRSLGL